MKKLPLFFGCIIFFATVLQASQHSDELLKLIKAGVSEQVIISYIGSSDSSFNLTADDISELKTAGASSALIIAAIQHKAKMPSVSNAQTQPSTSHPETVQPQPKIVYTSSPTRREAVNSWYQQRLNKMKQAIQLDVFGMAFNTFTANYEYLFAHRFGIDLEGNYYNNEDGSHGENIEWGLRLHLANSMRSPFVGIFLKGGRCYGNDQNPISPVDYQMTSVTLGPNIGQRWVSPLGFSVVGRIGYGYTWYEFDNSVPDNHTVDLLQRRANLDTELSIGYAF